MIKISKRLEAISSLIPNNTKILDIGCDHGLLDIYMYQTKKVKKIIAADVNKNALANAKKNIKENKLEKQIETRLGSGLEVLKENDDIDTIVLAGMGTHTIINILKKDLNKLKNIDTIIIQSNTKLSFLRKEMTKLKYLITDEKFVLDNNKYYTIIKYQKGKKRYNKKELFFGPIILKNKDDIFIKYQKEELKKLQIILDKLPKKKILARYKIKKIIRLFK